MTWNPTKSKKAREKQPAGNFLKPGERKYPVKRGGKYSREGLLAAYRRARQQGDSAVAAKAARLLKSQFGYTVGGGDKKKKK